MPETELKAIVGEYQKDPEYNGIYYILKDASWACHLWNCKIGNINVQKHALKVKLHLLYTLLEEDDNFNVYFLIAVVFKTSNY